MAGRSMSPAAQRRCSCTCERHVSSVFKLAFGAVAPWQSQTANGGFGLLRLASGAMWCSSHVRYVVEPFCAKYRPPPKNKVCVCVCVRERIRVAHTHTTTGAPSASPGL